MKDVSMTLGGTQTVQLAGARLMRETQSVIARVGRWMDERRAARRAARELAMMSDRDLHDIGLIRTDIPHALRHPIIDRPDLL